MSPTIKSLPSYDEALKRVSFETGPKTNPKITNCVTKTNGNQMSATSKSTDITSIN